MGLACALALALALGGPGLAGVGIDETVGGLPGTGGDSDDPTRPDVRASFFLQGNWAEVEAAEAAVTGTGDVENVQVAPGIVRRIYHGRFELALDEHAFRTTDVAMGVVTSTVSGATKYWISSDDIRSPIFTIAEGGVIDLPYERLRTEGMLDDGVALAAWNKVARDRFTLVREGGMVRVVTLR